jgi:NurA-like 5'-3' nuclease
LTPWGLAIRAKTRSGQTILADGEKLLQEFENSIRTAIEENGIEDIFNTDQTGINYEYLPTRLTSKVPKLVGQTYWARKRLND